MGRKYIWNTRQNTEVAYTPTLDVDGHPDLEWRDEPDPEPAAPQVEDPAPPKDVAKQIKKPAAKGRAKKG